MTLLEIKNISASYGFLQVLWDVSLKVEKGEFVALLGPNGAGKTTTLKTIAGLVQPMNGDVLLEGESIVHLPAHLVCKDKISYISETLNLFTAMSIEENLILGAYTIKDKGKKNESLEFVYELFPRLEERKKQLAGTLSGGERKMLAIGRGIMSSPEVMLVDEPSLGLAPNLTVDVFDALQTLSERGVTILLVEQNVYTTLKITDRAYVLEHGKIVSEGKSADLISEPHIKQAYLGI
jgi:ABC-type branched-subunit amino acid transport system ATPase component